VTIIEPAMLIIMGVVIASLLLALYMPLFQLTSVVGAPTT
jgi:type II secretory pathway component PulF